MTGLDRLLAKSLDSMIRNNLGDKIVKKIEDRLFEKYGISLTQSIEQFQKLDLVLRELFGAGADGLEQQFVKNLYETKTTDGENWVLIDDQILTKIVLDSFGDDDKKKILSTVNDQSLIISQILDACNIPQTSGYRKINSLIDDGLLVPSGSVITTDGKRVSRYRSIFDNIRIDIIKNKVTVRIHLINDDYLKSSVLSTCNQN